LRKTPICSPKIAKNCERNIAPRREKSKKITPNVDLPMSKLHNVTFPLLQIPLGDGGQGG
jgi:hypothetical protein